MTALEAIPDREELGPALNQLGLLGTVVEVGSAQGDFARIILSQWRGARLFMVDPWREQPSDVYKENQHGRVYELWRQRCFELAYRDPRASLLRMYSVEAARKFADDFLDAVYLDANQSFESVTDDLNAWWPKIKVGGILGGHDFLEKTDEGWFCQVKSAVEAWTAKRNLSFYVTPCTSFWIHKEK